MPLTLADFFGLLQERELASLPIPRGLITAVLVLEAIRAKPVDLMVLPSLTFALILLTNGLALVATVRAKGAATENQPELPTEVRK